MLFPQWYLIQTTLYHSINNWMLDQIDPSRPVPELRIPYHVRDGFTAGTVTTQMF